MIGHNNPPPDEPRDPLLNMPPEYLQYVLASARPVALREICERLTLPRLGELASKIYDAMLGPPVDGVTAGSLMHQLVPLLQEAAKAADERRRALQRKRQSRPEYKARKRERERGYRAAV